MRRRLAEFNARRGTLVGLYVTLALLATGAAVHPFSRDLGGAALGCATVVGLSASLAQSWRGLRRGRVGVDVLASLSLLGTLVVRELFAGAVVAVMVMTGEWLDAWAGSRAQRDLESLLRRAPTTAHRVGASGVTEVDAGAVGVGDRLRVARGEVVPVDGVLESDAVLDESSLTGESLPVRRGRDDEVRAGVANAAGPFTMVTTRRAADSTIEALQRLVRSASAERAPVVRLADRYAVGFLLATLAVAAVAAGLGGLGRAVAVLVVATPCPLLLAPPIALVAGMSRTARHGVVVKDGDALERLGRCTTLVTDKTGTLTTGDPVVTAIAARPGLGEDELLALAAAVDAGSPHPLARSLVREAHARSLGTLIAHDADECLGQGAAGHVNGRRVALGGRTWAGFESTPAWAAAVVDSAQLTGGVLVYVSIAGDPSGVIALADPLRDEARATVELLRRDGISRVVVLTGDRPEVARDIAERIGADEVMAQQGPAQKLAVVTRESTRRPTIMVGDGVNDAPALAAATVGVALALRGSTVASQVADVVVASDRLDRVGLARVVARRSRGLAVQSAIAGMVLSLAAMAAATAGVLPPVEGALLQEGIDLAVILNALRALRPPRGLPRGPVKTGRETDGRSAVAPNGRVGAGSGDSDVSRVSTETSSHQWRAPWPS